MQKGYLKRHIMDFKDWRTSPDTIENDPQSLPQAKLAKLRHQRETLSTRRVPPFTREKRVFNALVDKAAAEYDRTLRELNRRILTLNITTPSVLHQPIFEIEKLVQHFRESCPAV